MQLGTLSLIKGHGGALLREKIVASASKRMAVIVDETKLVKRLGGTLAVPVEVVPFGWEATARKLRAWERGRSSGLALTTSRTLPTEGTTFSIAPSGRLQIRKK